jgi:hypothetical protein
LRSSIDTSGLNESVWKSSEKEKLENLLDILDEVNGKFIQKIKIGILKDKFYLILHVMTIWINTFISKSLKASSDFINLRKIIICNLLEETPKPNANKKYKKGQSKTKLGVKTQPNSIQLRSFWWIDDEEKWVKTDKNKKEKNSQPKYVDHM